LTKPLELNCADYHVTSPSIGHGGKGAVFECTLSPVTDETLAALKDAVLSNRRIRFGFPKQPLLLESIEVVPMGPGLVRVAGRVVDADW
jgi:hypothetical protein